MSLLRTASIIYSWYLDPIKFFRDVAKQEPVRGQKEVLKMLRTNEDRILICAASGIGKTRVLAVCALWYCLILPFIKKKPIQVLILSGSLEQSKILYEFTREFIRNHTQVEALIEERLKTETRFKNGALLRALPCSERAYFGKHVDLLIIDEAALKDFPEALIDHALSIVAPIEEAKLIMSSTPYDANSRFVSLWNTAEEAGWKKIAWEALDCPFIKKENIDEAEKTLSKEQFMIRWKGQIVPTEDSLIRKESLKGCIVDNKPRKSLEPIVFGIDWGFSLEEGTEILTEQSWKSLFDITVRDKICTLNPNLEIEYQNPSNIVFSEGEHTCLEIKRGNLELHLRPRHLLPVISDYKKRFIFREPSELNHHYSLIRAGTFKGEDNIQWTKELLSFLGWYISEGCLGKGIKEKRYGQIRICQSPSSRFRKELENLAKSLFSKVNVQKNYISVYNKELYKYLFPLGKAETKYIPKEVKRLPGDKLISLLEALVKGDGEEWKYKCKNKVKSKVWRYYAKSKQLADDIQEVAIKTGRSAWIQKYRNLFRVNFILPRKRVVEQQDIVAYRSFRRFGSFSTPNETAMVRFNGKPCFVHNTHPTVLVVVQKEGENWNVLKTYFWKKARIDSIYNDLIQYYNQYKPEAVYTDSSHIFENNKLAELGLPIFPINFRQEKELMLTNLVSLIEHQKVSIWEEEVALIAQLRDYKRGIKKNDDWVDAMMLAVKEGVEGRNLPFFYKIIEYK